MPIKPGLPSGTLASWGAVQLEPLDNASVMTLAAGKVLRRGYLLDFLGNFARSAREGLPIYRLTGGAGFVWAASYQNGRGTLRFAALDTSAFMQKEAPGNHVVDEIDHSVIPAADPTLHITMDKLTQDQQARDALFRELKVAGAQYTFDYLVINLPAGALAASSVAILSWTTASPWAVSHANSCLIFAGSFSVWLLRITPFARRASSSRAFP
jgi:hypothetical protein